MLLYSIFPTFFSINWYSQCTVPFLPHEVPLEGKNFSSEHDEIKCKQCED